VLGMLAQDQFVNHHWLSVCTLTIFIIKNTFFSSYDDDKTNGDDINDDDNNDNDNYDDDGIEDDDDDDDDNDDV
jgi:hypothetical protein